MYIWQLDPANLTPYYDLALCDALAQAGHEVRFITTRFIYDPDLPMPTHFINDYRYFRGLNWRLLMRYPRLRRGLRAFSYPLGHMGVLRLARQCPPDLIHIQWSRLPRLDLPIWRRLAHRGIPLVHTVHDIAPMFAKARMQIDLARIYHHMDALILHTQANLRAFQAQYPTIPAHKLHLVPMIAFPNPPMPADASQSAARQVLGLPHDAPIALFFGAIKHYKGLDVLVDAFTMARDRHPDSQLIIAGKYELGERGKLPALDKLMAMPHVHVYEGFIPTRDIWIYHLAADVIVHPYREITQSAALITAMGFGRAVIVTDVGGMGETVQGNGWVVPAEDATALADALCAAFADRSRLHDMGTISKAIIDQHHRPERVASRLIQIYQQLRRM